MKQPENTLDKKKTQKSNVNKTHTLSEHNKYKIAIFLECNYNFKVYKNFIGGIS